MKKKVLFTSLILAFSATSNGASESLFETGASTQDKRHMSEGEALVTDNNDAPLFGAATKNSTLQKQQPLNSSEFSKFNAKSNGQWKATSAPKTGKVRLLYGAVSLPYGSDPENAARSFLKESAGLFGIKADLSGLRVTKVDKTPLKNHVKFEQTFNGVPVVGAQILVHSNTLGQITMVQNAYSPELTILNQDKIQQESAINIARNDLQSSQAQATHIGNSKAEKQLFPQQGSYIYLWKVTTPTQTPPGHWVYHINGETGQIIYKANEMLSLKNGSGRAYTSDSNWLKGKISKVTLPRMFTKKEGYIEGYLRGEHANIMDDNGNDAFSAKYKFIYDPAVDKDKFDATHAYYQMDTIWLWWNKNVIKKFGPDNPDFFYSYVTPAVVNVTGFCNGLYTPDLNGDNQETDPGFEFGDEGSCDPSSEDWALDNSIFRHEFAHAMMDWNGFDNQFSSAAHNYGRAMGEGNSDWYAYLFSKEPQIGTVAGNWTDKGYLRTIDNTRRYPEDVDCPTDTCGADWVGPEEHYTGEIWGGYLYDLSDVLGNNALKYDYESHFYFDPADGHVAGLPDFFDAVYAQFLAEADSTGTINQTSKAWGSMASRGFNVVLRSPYAHASDYFDSGIAGQDDKWFLFLNFPPAKSLTTTSKLLNNGDVHEYIIKASAALSELTVTVSQTSKSKGMVNPEIKLYREADEELIASSNINTSTESILTATGLTAGQYFVISVTGAQNSSGFGDYTVKIAGSP